MTRQVVDIDMLLALNPEYEQALWKGEKWALDHMKTCKSLNAGEPEGFRRKFDGKPRKWCGGACTSPEGCVVCTLDENPEMARFNREYKDHPTLAKEGIIVISGEINEAMLTHVRSMIEIAERNNAEKLEVRIESNGGDVGAGLDICDLIRYAPVETRTGVVSTYARSMGAMILQSCDRREAAPDAKILIHHTHFGDSLNIETLKDPERIRRILEYSEPDEALMTSMLIDRTGRTLDEIKEVCTLNKDMSSREALLFGLIDAIRD